MRAHSKNSKNSAAPRNVGRRKEEKRLDRRHSEKEVWGEGESHRANTNNLIHHGEQRVPMGTHITANAPPFQRCVQLVLPNCLD